MRYLIGSQMGWVAVPVIILAGAAYIWVMDRLVGRKSEITAAAETSAVKKVA